MKKVLVVLFLCLAVASAAVACDTCGCQDVADAMDVIACDVCGEAPCVCEVVVY